MLHLGDITKIHGGEAPVVDVVIGGSPCQDLSIAGKRAGLAGARSGLYMEQIRIIKEMRARDMASGRTGEFVRPRYMVWENVPGAFSSNGGKDFAAVLEEAIRVAEPEAPDIEVPEKGWNTWGGYHDEMGGRWSVAWRVLDAQHWGVPQRRRRIALVADFGGDTAWEILFERKSVSGYPAESGAAWEGPAAGAESGAAYAVRIRGGCDGGGKGALVKTEKSGTIKAGNDQTLFCMATQQGGAEVRSDDRAPTLTASAGMSGNNQPVVCAGFKLGNSEQARSIGYAEEQAPTLNAECGGNKPAVMCLNDQGGNVMGVSHDVAGTLRAQEHGHQPAVMAFDTTQITSKQNGSIPDFGKPCHTLNANAHVPCAGLNQPVQCFHLLSG
jgi:DNA (cytosine-5)-methyltransferase 1